MAVATLMCLSNASCMPVDRFTQSEEEPKVIHLISRLTFPLIAPPLPNVEGRFSIKSARLMVVRSLTCNRELYPTVKHDDGKVRQIDLMDLIEDLLSHSRICSFLFLLIKSLQGRITIEAHITPL